MENMPFVAFRVGHEAFWGSQQALRAVGLGLGTPRCRLS